MVPDLLPKEIVMNRGQLLAFLWSLPAVLVLPSFASAEVPEALRDLVIGARQRPEVEVRIHENVFRALPQTITDALTSPPYLLWPDQTQVSAIPEDQERLAKWLSEEAQALGHFDFQLRFEETLDWRGMEVWSYHLEKSGLELHDSFVNVYWDQGRILGILNDVPHPVAFVETPSLAPGIERVYLPEREQDGSFRLVVGVVTHEDLGSRIKTVIQGGGSSYTSYTPTQANLGFQRPRKFKEIRVTSGTFPDQIGVDSSGKVWFSQPLNDWLTKYDPATNTFTQIPTGAGSGPDGMIVDSQDFVWTGLYFNGRLGRYNQSTGNFRSWAAPLGMTSLAIPGETQLGTIWVTDHTVGAAEFDPVSKTWLQVVSVANEHIVQPFEHRRSGDIYFTVYSTNKIGHKPVGGAYQGIPVHQGGPAFLAVLNDRVFYSEWVKARLGEYDIATGQIIEHNFPIPGEWGGPLGIAPNGDIVVGTRNRGYIMVFDPRIEEFIAYLIPTPNPGLKDGLTVARDGTIWFTESGVDKIASLGPR